MSAPPRQPGRSASTPASTGRGTSGFRARRIRTLPANLANLPVEVDAPRRPAPSRLRLTPGSADAPPATVRNAPQTTPLQGSSDPRWVLAVRTAELLQGNILSPERRERIVRMAKLFDLTPFDANMIIAIVQDQARRGIAPHLCPAAGEPQLRMITPPKRTTILQAIGSRYGTKVMLLLSILIAIEAAILWWAF